MTHDPLVEALSLVLKLHQRDISVPALSAAIPLPPRVSPALFVRLAEANDCMAVLKERSLDRIPELVLPVILLLKDQQVCVLVRKVAEGNDGYVICLAESGVLEQPIGRAKLESLYTGECFFVRPPLAEDARSGATGNSESTANEGASETRLAAQRGHWFWSTLWRYRGYYTETAVAAVLINVLALASTFFTMNVYDRVVPNQAFVTLWTLAIGVGVAMGFEFLARNLRAWLLDNAGKKADLILGAALFRQTLQMRLEHRASSPGAFANNLREFESLRDFATSATLAGLSDLPFLILFIWVIGLIAGPLFWVPVLCIPLILCITLLVQIPLARLISENQREASIKHGVLIEAIEATETIKATRAENWLQSQYEMSSALTASTGMKSRLLSNLVMHFCATVQAAAAIVMVVWGVYLIADGKLTMGALIGAVMLCSRALAPLGQVTALGVRYQQARSALKNLNRIMALPTDREAGRSYLDKRSFAGALQCKAIAFSYGKELPNVLSGFDLAVRPGERVAILGRIGSGKSTLLKVISGLYLPAQGQVLVDGLDIGQIEPSAVRQHIAYVPQEPRLFHGSLRQNLLVGNPGASEDWMLMVCEKLGIHRFASQHPRGYDMLINERGEGLSGGQRQAVALARALIAKPSVLLLDEPTSAMDQGTEQATMQALAMLAPKKTILLVTHRLQLVEHMERVVVIDNGSRVADGPREQVMRALTEGKVSAATQATAPVTA
jgi:ATP-binding cassette, subfamily C, bacterial LapB